VLDGKIFVLGGSNAGGRFYAAQRTVRIHDLTMNKWTDGPPMLASRYNLGVGVIRSLNGVDELYAVGGGNPSGIASVERHTAGAGSWELVAPLSENRGHAIMTAVVNNVLYAIGGGGGQGRYCASNQMYVPDQKGLGKWVSRTPITVESKVVPMAAGAAASWGGGIYIFGGESLNSGPLSTTLVYDASSDRWSRGADMPFARRYGRAFSIGSRIYVIGGADETNKSIICVYDPLNENWLESKSFPGGNGLRPNLAQAENQFFVIGDDCTKSSKQEVWVGVVPHALSTEEVRAIRELKTESQPPRIYWTDINAHKIQRSRPEGSNIEDLVTGLASPGGIAVDPVGGKMYWTDIDASRIQRSDLAGTNVEDLVVRSLGSPVGIALDTSAGKMYWADRTKARIQRANLDGSGVENLVIGLGGPLGVALDISAGKMYWTDATADKIQRANLDGTSVENLVTSDLKSPREISLDLSARKMYWPDGATGRIQRANLDGTNMEDLVTGLSSKAVHGFALDLPNGRMYWAERSGGRIRRADLDGGNIEDVIITGLDYPYGLTVTSVQPKSTPISPDKKEQLTLSLAKGVTMKLVRIESGKFLMGSPKSEIGRDEGEGPQRLVTIGKPFYMGVTEVTQSQWKSVMGTEPWSGKRYAKSGDSHAVSYITWDDANRFCKAVSRKTGREVTLPTEAQWEYACRAGSKTKYSFGDDDSKLGSYAWYDGNADKAGEDYAHAVGLKKPNAWGLYDMHGNAWEWCRDWYDAGYYAKAKNIDPENTTRALVHVLRGGSWSKYPRDCRAAIRYGFSTNHCGGFRVVALCGPDDITRPAKSSTTIPMTTGPGQKEQLALSLAKGVTMKLTRITKHLCSCETMCLLSNPATIP